MDVLTLVAALTLSAVFAVAGITKLTDHAGTRTAVRAFGGPAAAAPALALLLPVCELVVAAALLVPATRFVGAAGALGLLVLFTAVIAVSLARGRAPECHCFGQLHSAPASWKTLFATGSWARSRSAFWSQPGATPGRLPGMDRTANRDRDRRRCRRRRRGTGARCDRLGSPRPHPCLRESPAPARGHRAGPQGRGHRGRVRCRHLRAGARARSWRSRTSVAIPLATSLRRSRWTSFSTPVSLFSSSSRARTAARVTP